MNHKHRKILHTLFAHPISANIAPKDVLAVFGELGAETEERHSGHIAVRLNGQFTTLHHPHHSLSKDDVVHIRKFLEECGIDPERDYPL